jgi:hypothetical protein
MEIKDLAGISEPLKRLFEIISDFFGGISRPYFTKKNAEAKAHETQVMSQAIAEGRKVLVSADYEYADGKIKILAPSDPVSKIPELTERAANRNEYQELHKQQNIESVCANAAEELAGESQVPENKPEPEWIDHFFDIAEKISTEDLQYWWGKILAGEIKKPRSFSLRTLEVLKNMSRQEAENFVKLGQYVLHVKPSMTFFLEPDEYIFKQDNSLTFAEILCLREAGLVTNSDSLGISLAVSNKGDTTQLFYGSLVLLLEREHDIHQTTNNVVSLAKSDTELLKPSSMQTHMEYLTFKVIFLTESGTELLKLITT